MLRFRPSSRRNDAAQKRQRQHECAHQPGSNARPRQCFARLLALCSPYLQLAQTHQTHALNLTLQLGWAGIFEKPQLETWPSRQLVLNSLLNQKKRCSQTLRRRGTMPMVRSKKSSSRRCDLRIFDSRHFGQVVAMSCSLLRTLGSARVGVQIAAHAPLE